MSAKKIMVFMGSLRKKETLHFVQTFEARRRELVDVDVEDVRLKEYNLQQCKGCFQGLFKGGELCSLKADRDQLVQKLHEADGVVFAAPNYTLHVPALMKNFFEMIYKRHCFIVLRLLLVCALTTHLMSCAYTPSIGGLYNPGVLTGVGSWGQVKPGHVDVALPVRSPNIRVSARLAFSGSVDMGTFISKRTVAIVVGAGLATVYLLLPAAMGVVTVFPHQEQVGAPPKGFEDVTLTTTDSVALQAWYAPPANGAAIILIHGAGNSRESVRAYADMLVRHKYGVLALDLRGHGASAGSTNRLGWQSTPDVGAAVAFLQQRPEGKAIGGLGLSLGGEVLLGAASEYLALRAIVADGATRRSLDELLALESERPLYRNFTARVMFATVQLFSRARPPKPLLDSIRETTSTRFFLIAGAQKSSEVAFNKLFAEAVGERVTLWIAPDVGHTEAFSRYPAEYEQRVIEFLDDALCDHQDN